MKNVKTTFRFFTIYQYEQEEKYLTSMHEKGWRMTGVTFPGFYSFEKTEPEHVVYRLDYNKEGLTHKDEYVQMFADCGWEYIQEFVGYSYFRKKITDEDQNEEIFCDDSEIIFSLDTKNIYLSCPASELLHIGKRVYLMGTGVAYRLNRDDEYADMSSDEMAETCLELFGRMQRVWMAGFGFPVLDLTDMEADDEEEK